MNLYIKKISTLAGVGVISILSTFQTFTNVDAALTKPTNYHIGFESISSAFYYTSSNGTSPTSIALFTRTADSSYFNYTHNFSSGQHSNTSNYDLPLGLDITMTFNRSNSSWTDASGAGFTGYYASDTKIGSNANVGSILSKTYFNFNNQTSNDYYLYIDFSTTGGSRQHFVLLNGQYYITYNNNNDFFVLNTAFTKVFIPSYSTLEFYSSTTSNALYFDAWYLQDVGLSSSFEAGYDAGELWGISQGYTDGYSDGLGNNPNVLLNGFQAMVGILVNFMLLILNLNVFGVSILSVFSIVALFVGFIWILKIIRG
jgi:hypothetical protein